MTIKLLVAAAISMVLIARIESQFAEAGEWKVVDEPDLKERLDNAELLEIEKMGVAVRGVDTAGTLLVPNPDGRTYDILQWYRKAYRKSTRVYIADLGTGEVKKQTFEEEEGRIRMEMGFGWWGVFAPDGKLYGANPDWIKWDSGGVMNIYQYDPGKNEVKLFKVIPGCGGERNPMALSPNGWIYGVGTYLGEDADSKRKAAAFGFEPKTGQVRNYGAVGPRINGTGYGYSMGVCDTHIYVACGQIPWYLVAIDIETGKQEVLLEASEGGYHMRMNISPRYGGAISSDSSRSPEDISSIVNRTFRLFCSAVVSCQVTSGKG